MERAVYGVALNNSFSEDPIYLRVQRRPDSRLNRVVQMEGEQMEERESRRARKSGNTEVVLLLSPKCSIIVTLVPSQPRS